MVVDLRQSFHTPSSAIFTISNIVVLICFFIICLAVLIDFIEFQKRKQIKREKKSFVETGTMFLFFFLFYSLIRFGIGRFTIPSTAIKTGIMMIGSLALIVGCFVNVRGRLDLGKNWANQIKIYQDHAIISKGMYGIVRHPLYASIIWMFFGAGLVYLNYLALLSNLLIFIPCMYYRAKQEETALVQEFEAYKTYQKNVGMFFPKVI
jgi:protein-S-isoprenylcysteine O-methyltransferase Ste14